MGFIGVQPASALLSSADIQDGQITTAKIADTAVTTAKITDANITSAKLGSDVIQGVTFFETMRLSSSISGSGGDINGTFESVDTGTPAKKLISSTGMSSSSGIFTFPATGMYLLMARMRYFADADITYSGLIIKTSNDNFSSNDVEASEGYGSWGTHSGSNNYEMIAVDFLFDCTDTSTHKFKMRYTSTGSITLGNSTGTNMTYVTVIRLGDT
tara:strand:+ start:67 stop:708 length:642 start_codon:yes stop_codon:yes gene_type:complete